MQVVKYKSSLLVLPLRLLDRLLLEGCSVKQTVVLNLAIKFRKQSELSSLHSNNAISQNLV